MRWPFLLLLPLTLWAEVAAVHPGIDEASLTASRLRDIYLGRVTTWQNGTPVLIVLIDDPACAEAVRTVVGRDQELLLRGWKRLVYAGSGAMPTVCPNRREAMAQVARHRGAVAILPGQDLVDGVRMIPVARPER